MAPRRIHTRIFPDPNPPKVVENPERILKRSNIKVDKGIPHLLKSLSLPVESVKSVESITFDKGTDQSLSRSKFASIKISYSTLVSTYTLFLQSEFYCPIPTVN